MLSRVVYPYFRRSGKLRCYSRWLHIVDYNVPESSSFQLNVSCVWRSHWSTSYVCGLEDQECSFGWVQPLCHLPVICNSNPELIWESGMANTLYVGMVGGVIIIIMVIINFRVPRLSACCADSSLSRHMMRHTCQKRLVLREVLCSSYVHWLLVHGSTVVLFSPSSTIILTQVKIMCMYMYFT